MSMKDTATPVPETKPQLSHGGGSKKPPRHYVENARGDRDPLGPFEPAQTTLCGKPWDRLFVKHNGEICQDCIDELKRRGHG